MDNREGIHTLQEQREGDGLQGGHPHSTGAERGRCTTGRASTLYRIREREMDYREGIHTLQEQREGDGLHGGHPHSAGTERGRWTIGRASTLYRNRMSKVAGRREGREGKEIPKRRSRKIS